MHYVEFKIFDYVYSFPAQVNRRLHNENGVGISLARPTSSYLHLHHVKTQLKTHLYYHIPHNVNSIYLPPHNNYFDYHIKIIFEEK